MSQFFNNIIISGVSFLSLPFQAYHAGHASQHAELYTFFTHMFSWTDISDHKGGVLLLSCLLLTQSGVAWYGRKVSVVIGGGSKRLQALASVVATAAMLPWALYHYQNMVRVIITEGGGLVRFVVFSLNLIYFYVFVTVSVRGHFHKIVPVCSLFNTKRRFFYLRK